MKMRKCPGPGYVLIFRPYFTTKNGKIVFAGPGRVFPMWVKA